MIPEYKRFHGAVLAELVDRSPQAISIEEWPDRGRLASYIINNQIGLYIKHSGSRLYPWQFTFTRGNFDTIRVLQSRCRKVFVVLVCWVDGMVSIAENELVPAFPEGTEQLWLRAERRKGEWYTVSGPMLTSEIKRPNGVDSLMEELQLTYIKQPETLESPRISSFFRATYWKKLLGDISDLK